MPMLFLTVGSTQFDELIHAASTILEFLDRHFTRVVIQHGASPRPKLEGLPKFEVFDYADSIANYINEADVIVAHAGAGTAIEALRAGKKLVIVPNQRLLDNHQLELAEELSAEQYCLTSDTKSLESSIRTAMDFKQRPFPEPNNKILNEIFNYYLTVGHVY